MPKSKKTTTLPIKWIKSKKFTFYCENHEVKFGSNMIVYVYGGYSRDRKAKGVAGWYIQTSCLKPLNYPNRFIGGRAIKALKRAKDLAVVAGLATFTRCLIENKPIERLDVYDAFFGAVRRL